jgi:hypothetical protein
MNTFKHTLFLFAILIAHSTFAQTKEETVKYINEIVKASKGYVYTDNLQNPPCKVTVERQDFSLEQFMRITNDCVFNNESYYTEIPWLLIKEITRGKAKEDSELVTIAIDFDGYLVQKSRKDSEIHKMNTFWFYVLKSKADNVEKALKHLQELLKKEDPFGN